MSERLRIAISGDAASGKDTTGAMFETHGLQHVSCSNVLRGYITDNQLGIPDPEVMTKVAHDLRDSKGATYLVDYCLNQFSDVDLAVSGIYSPAEALKFKSLGGFVVVVICQDPLVRFARDKLRSGRPETLSYEDFLARQTKENTGNSQQQDVAGIAEMADFQITNEGTFDELRGQVDSVYQIIMESRNGHQTAA